MLENHGKGYNMVKKVCTIMHSLVDDWKPSPCTSRPGKPWRVVIPARIPKAKLAFIRSLMEQSQNVECKKVNYDDVLTFSVRLTPGEW